MWDYYIIPTRSYKDHYVVRRTCKTPQEERPGDSQNLKDEIRKNREILIIDGTVRGGVRWVPVLEVTTMIPEKTCFPSAALAASVLVASFAADDGIQGFMKRFGQRFPR